MTDHKYIILYFPHYAFYEIPYLLKPWDLERGQVRLRSPRLRAVDGPSGDYYANLGWYPIEAALGYSIKNFPYTAGGMGEEDLPKLLEKYPNMKVY